jgi:hypothetical protein
MTFRIFTATAAALAAIAAMALAAPLSVTAQSIRPEAGQPVAVNDAEIKSFAAAVVEVKRVTDSYLPMLAGARTTEEKDRVENAAFAEIKEVVASEGFTVSRFNQILSLASASPDLVDQIRLHLPQ